MPDFRKQQKWRKLVSRSNIKWAVIGLLLLAGIPLTPILGDILGLVIFFASIPTKEKATDEFTAKITLSVNVKGEPTTVEGLLICERFTVTNESCPGCLRWRIKNRQNLVVHPLEAGGALLVGIDNRCKELADGRSVTAAKATLGWVDDMDVPSMFEFYDVVPADLAQFRATQRAVRTETTHAQYNRLTDGTDSGIPYAAGIFTPAEIGINRKGSVTPKTFKSIRVRVVPEEEWVLVPSLSEVLEGLTEVSPLPPATFELLRREFLGKASAPVGFLGGAPEDPTIALSPYWVPLEHLSRNLWRLDREKAGVNTYYNPSNDSETVPPTVRVGPGSASIVFHSQSSFFNALTREVMLRPGVGTLKVYPLR